MIIKNFEKTKCFLFDHTKYLNDYIEVFKNDLSNYDKYKDHIKYHSYYDKLSFYIEYEISKDKLNDSEEKEQLDNLSKKLDEWIKYSMNIIIDYENK